MRVAVLADIHGNLPALEAVLDEVTLAGAGLIVVAGDLLPGPMGAECLSRLGAIDVPVRYLTGNGERVTLDAVDGKVLGEVPEPYRPAIEWGAARLTAAQVTQLRLWPPTVDVAVEGLGQVLCCHATPRSDIEVVTRRTPEDRVAPAFLGVTAPLVICGHTHLRMDRQIAGRRVVNPGSVGMPFDETGAHWLLLEAGGPRFVHTRYDLEAAAGRIRASGYPDGESFAASYVLAVPGEDVMLAALSAGD